MAINTGSLSKSFNSMSKSFKNNSKTVSRALGFGMPNGNKKASYFGTAARHAFGGALIGGTISKLRGEDFRDGAKRGAVAGASVGLARTAAHNQNIADKRAKIADLQKERKSPEYKKKIQDIAEKRHQAQQVKDKIQQSKNRLKAERQARELAQKNQKTQQQRQEDGRRLMELKAQQKKEGDKIAAMSPAQREEYLKNRKGALTNSAIRQSTGTQMTNAQQAKVNQDRARQAQRRQQAQQKIAQERQARAQEANRKAMQSQSAAQKAQQESNKKTQMAHQAAGNAGMGSDAAWINGMYSKYPFYYDSELKCFSTFYDSRIYSDIQYNVIPYNKENIQKYKSPNNMLKHAQVNSNIDGAMFIGDNDNLLGYIGWTKDGYITGLEVIDSYRGHGLGYDLLDSAVKSNAVTYATVKSDSRTAKSTLEFYKKFGFQTFRKQGNLIILKYNG